MPRTGHLTSPADFRRTYSGGTRASTPSVVAHVLARPGRTRVGVTASRGLGGAVARNRAKRRLREAVRIVRPEIKQNVDVILVASNLATRIGFQDLVDNVRQALRSAGGLG